MSIQGTGVAAGVAQTALQAQQVCRAREAPAQLHGDENPAEHHHGPQHELAQSERDEAEDADDDVVEQDTSPADRREGQPLYRHVDIRA